MNQLARRMVAGMPEAANLSSIAACTRATATKLSRVASSTEIFTMWRTPAASAASIKLDSISTTGLG